MPFRRLPDSDVTRAKALDDAFKKYNLVKAANGIPSFSDALFDRLELVRPPFTTAIHQAGITQNNQSRLTDLAEKAATSLRRFVSHFIQVFNFAIERGEFAPADRAFYQLPVSSSEVPALDSETDLITAANNIVEGEKNRLLAQPGAKAMDLPTAAQVKTARDAYETLLGQQSTAKSANDDAEEAIAKLRPEVDEVIRKIWNDIEHTYEDDEPASLRRKAREYGVVYALRPGEPPEETGTPTPPANP